MVSLEENIREFYSPECIEMILKCGEKLKKESIMDKYMQIAKGEIDGYDPLEPCPMPIDLSFDNVPISKDTPSAWIPVTERLPDDNVLVLAAFDTRDGIDYGCAWHYSDEQGWRCWDDMVCNSGPIVAWMPIPEYEVRDEETD